ncbi:porin [Burkholderia sp. Ac-20365]|uniref:porin n=1 Tax=Burkholderia sp. Ac-20365 TaxID=2703897 RepID=UPI00197B2AEB|nr:porin [Burkholderia sp. Ac-20365]MBN3761749.1 porin [Burkholderia sp. Ac-20365]
MKKSMLAVALPALAVCSVAHAQSSVTLYGLIDEGLNFTSNANGHHGYQMVSGDTVGSRWGIRGSEDLGGGLSAVFRLENGFNINNGALGQGGAEFGRQAYVGLSSNQYGTLTMGTQYDPTVDMWSGFTSAGNLIGDLSAHPYDNDNADWDYRIHNSVKYVSPTIAGFTGEAMYGFSNEAGGFANNRMYSAAGSYKLGPISAAVAYMKINAGGATSTGALSSSTSVFTAQSQQNIDAGLSYTFTNNAVVSLAYSHVDVYNPTSNAYFSTQPEAGSQNSWKFDNYEINGQYFFKPDFWLAAAYTFTQAHIATTTGNFSPKWNQVSLMLDYDISKRTSVYVQGAYQHADGDTGLEFDNASIIGSAGTSSSGNQMVYRVAMLHRF